MAARSKEGWRPLGSIRVYVYPLGRKRDTAWKVQWRENHHQASRTFETAQEADDYAAIKKGELVSGKSFDARPGKIRFRDYWNDDYLVYYFPKLSVKTQASYAAYYRRLLEPFFGDTSLKDITRANLKQWVKWCQDPRSHDLKISTHSIKEAFVVLRSVLTRAVNDDK